MRRMWQRIIHKEALLREIQQYLAIYGEVMVIGLCFTNVLYHHDLVADDWEIIV